MWLEKQENTIFTGETRAAPRRFQGGPMENKILPSPSGTSDTDFLAESSRKRKSIAMDQQCSLSESVQNYCFPRKSNLQCDTDQHFGNIQGNTLGMFPNQPPQSFKPITFGHRHENDQFQGQNDFTENWQTVNRNFHKIGGEKISNSYLSAPPQAFHHRGPLPLINFSPGVAVSNWQPQQHNMFSHSEANKSPSFLNSCKSHTGNAEVGPGNNLICSEKRNHVVTDDIPFEVSNSQSDSLRSLELLRQNFVKPDRFSIDLDGKACFQEASKSATPCYSKKSGNSFSTSGINVISSFAADSCGGPSCTEQNKVHSVTVPLGAGLDFDRKDNGPGHVGESINPLRKTESLDVENSNDSFVEEALQKDGYSPTNVVAEHGQRNDQNHGSLIVDVKSNSLSGTVALTFGEKLWDGCLQLSSSVTLSAVAFFKSGEKTPDVNWSEFVEVKGKVRLEAFEKYIQDLPRSRNRGLMVISLCWKEGSPETGLVGMKQVAKGYKKSSKVGFAQLSPGIDLYICPRSDTIITILAKYGYFKGIVAFLDKQDSMIGCVVWRRNQTSSNEKKSERKNDSLSEKPLNSPSDPSTQKIAEKIASLPESNQESSSITTTLEHTGNNVTKIKDIESTEVQLEGANSLLIPSVPSNSPSISTGIQTSSCTHTEPSAPLKQSSEVEKSVLLPPSHVTEPLVSPPDDDDLPEFDFGISCMIHNAATIDKKLPSEGSGKKEGSVPPTMPIVQSISTPKHQRRYENLNLPRFPSPAANQGVTAPQKVGERKSQIPFFPNQSSATMTPVSAGFPQGVGQGYGNLKFPRFPPPAANQGMTLPQKVGERESQIRFFPNQSSASMTQVTAGFPPDASRGYENLNLPRFPPPAANPGMALLHIVGERESQIPFFANQSSAAITPVNVGFPPDASQGRIPFIPNQSCATMTPVTSTGVSQPKKNLFNDDDDDMPEWCPPDLEPCKAEISTVSSSNFRTCSPAPPWTVLPCQSPAPSSSFQTRSPAPPWTVLPCQSPASSSNFQTCSPALPWPVLFPRPSPVPTHPRAFPPHPYNFSTTVSMKPAQPRPGGGYMQRGLTSSMGFNTNPAWRPPPDTFSPGWRGWRP